LLKSFRHLSSGHCHIEQVEAAPPARSEELKVGSRDNVPESLPRIEQGVGRLKRFKRVALRCEKTVRNFRSIVSFAAGLCLIKFVHTA
jgi:hypothetical protein